MSLDSFASILSNLWPRGRGGGRRPSAEDDIDSQISNGSQVGESEQPLYLQPLREGEQARLTIVQITDVYTLDNFASLKTFLKTLRAAQGENDTNNQVFSMLTGDFLAPYLLSSVDAGAGMMHALKRTPIDALTWG